MGVPIISTDLGGVNELLENDKYGKAIKTTNVTQEEIIAEISKETLAMISQNKMSEQEKRQWHASCKKKYDLSIFNDNAIEAFRQLMHSLDLKKINEDYSRSVLDVIHSKVSF